MTNKPIEYHTEIGAMMSYNSYDTSRYPIEDLIGLYRVQPGEVSERVADYLTGSVFIRNTDAEWSTRYNAAKDAIAHEIAFHYAPPLEEEPDEDWSDWSDDDERYWFGQGSDLEP